MSDFCEYQWSTRRDLNIIKNNQQQPNDIKKFDKKFNYNYNEVTERTLALNKLKELIGASIDLALKDKSLCNDDDFLLRFLYARKFLIDDTFKLIINYNLYRQRNKVLLKNLTSLDENIQMSLRDGFPGVLTERDRRGRKVLVFFTANWDYRLYSLITIYRALLLSLEKLLEDKQNQANGFVAIVDWTNFTLRQSTHLNPKILKLMIEGLQDCFPVRFKAIHFIGQPWYVEAALAVIRPFLKDKTSARIKLHGSNLSTLHECVARDILPPELGGEGITFNPLTWVHALLESSQLPSNKLETCTYFITQKTIYSKPLPPLTANTNINNVNNDNEDTDNDDIDDEKKTLQHDNRTIFHKKKHQQHNNYMDNDNNEINNLKNNSINIKLNNLNNNNSNNNNNNILKNTNKNNDPAKNMLLSFNNDDI